MTWDKELSRSCHWLHNGTQGAGPKGMRQAPSHLSPWGRGRARSPSCVCLVCPPPPQLPQPLGAAAVNAAPIIPRTLMLLLGEPLVVPGVVVPGWGGHPYGHLGTGSCCALAARTSRRLSQDPGKHPCPMDRVRVAQGKHSPAPCTAAASHIPMPVKRWATPQPSGPAPSGHPDP